MATPRTNVKSFPDVRRALEDLARGGGGSTAEVVDARSTDSWTFKTTAPQGWISGSVLWTSLDDRLENIEQGAFFLQSEIERIGTLVSTSDTTDTAVPLSLFSGTQGSHGITFLFRFNDLAAANFLDRLCGATGTLTSPNAWSPWDTLLATSAANGSEPNWTDAGLFGTDRSLSNLWGGIWQTTGGSAASASAPGWAANFTAGQLNQLQTMAEQMVEICEVLETLIGALISRNIINDV